MMQQCMRNRQTGKKEKKRNKVKDQDAQDKSTNKIPEEKEGEKNIELPDEKTVHESQKQNKDKTTASKTDERKDSDKENIENEGLGEKKPEKDTQKAQKDTQKAQKAEDAEKDTQKAEKAQKAQKAEDAEKDTQKAEKAQKAEDAEDAEKDTQKAEKAQKAGTTDFEDVFNSKEEAEKQKKEENAAEDSEDDTDNEDSEYMSIGAKNMAQFDPEKDNQSEPEFSMFNIDVYFSNKNKDRPVLLLYVVEILIVSVIVLFLPMLIVGYAVFMGRITKEDIYFGIFEVTKTVWAKKGRQKMDSEIILLRSSIFAIYCYAVELLVEEGINNALVVCTELAEKMDDSPLGMKFRSFFNVLNLISEYLIRGVFCLLLLCGYYYFVDAEIVRHPFHRFDSQMSPVRGFINLLILTYAAYRVMLVIGKYLTVSLIISLKKRSFEKRVRKFNYRTFLFKKLYLIARAKFVGDEDQMRRVIENYRIRKTDYTDLFSDTFNFQTKDFVSRTVNYIYYALGGHRITYKDIVKYFDNSMADVDKAYYYFSGTKENTNPKKKKKITRKTIMECAEQHRIDLKNFKQTLKDRTDILNVFDTMMSFIVLGTTVLLMLFQMTTKENVFAMITSIGTMLMWIGWIFKDTLKEVYTNLLFLTYNSPYDTGDRVSIDGFDMVVMRINLMYTTFCLYNGTVVYVPNTILTRKYIQNVRRSRKQCEEIRIALKNVITVDKLVLLRESVESFVKRHVSDYMGVVDMKGVRVEKDDTKTIVIELKHNSNFQNNTAKFVRQQKFVRYVYSVLDKLDIKYEDPLPFIK